MTPQEAKKMLKAKLECLKNETSGINHDCNMRLCDGCSLNYEQGNMGEQKESLQMAIKALESQRWIPVSERLPEDGRTVLVWYEYFRYGDYNKLFQTYGLSYAYGGHWSEFVNGESGWKDLRIIAWMPLPPSYQGE